MIADVVIIGAGAAGLLCAVEAARRGRRVLVLEHNAQIGRKILISGGGRCNFTNLHTGPENFLSANPHFAKSALARYPPARFLALIDKHRIAWHEKKLGQLFCDGSAREVVAMLRAECEAAGAGIVTACAVSEVRRPDRFVLATSQGEVEAGALVIATGGLSVPKVGATGFGYRIARQFGHRIVETRPGLAPLVFAEAERRRFGALAGVSTEVAASAGGHCFREKLLFTHRGVSGPAILQVSSYWTPEAAVEIDWAPGIDLEREWLRRKQAGDRSTTRAVLGEYLPQRLADRWVEAPKPLEAAAGPELAALARGLRAWCFVPRGTEGYQKAEVTAGGVDTDQLSSRTMESRLTPGLYFIGEVVDVTGHLGGFNFQWAWASGWVAGQFV